MLHLKRCIPRSCCYSCSGRIQVHIDVGHSHARHSLASPALATPYTWPHLSAVGPSEPPEQHCAPCQQPACGDKQPAPALHNSDADHIRVQDTLYLPSPSCCRPRYMCVHCQDTRQALTLQLCSSCGDRLTNCPRPAPLQLPAVAVRAIHLSGQLVLQADGCALQLLYDGVCCLELLRQLPCCGLLLAAELGCVRVLQAGQLRLLEPSSKERGAAGAADGSMVGCTV
jgi:hypothetical protein